MTDNASTASESCHYCGTTESDLRPYGPGGSWVCFTCATSTPEREKAAESAFGALLDATSEMSSVVVIGDSEGPRPLRASDLQDMES